MANEENTLQFPCEFVLKIFGLANEEFEITALTIIRKHVTFMQENAIRTRHSEDKKYLALTVTLHIESREQLDNLYRELSSSKKILMVL